MVFVVVFLFLVEGEEEEEMDDGGKAEELTVVSLLPERGRYEKIIHYISDFFIKNNNHNHNI